MMMCDDAHFHRNPLDVDPQKPLPHGLNLKSAKIKGDLSLKRICSVGVVVLDGAQIDRDVDFEGAQIDGSARDPKDPNRHPDHAIFAPAMKIGGDLRLSQGFKANGQVHIPGTVMKGSLDCGDGIFANGKDTSLFGAMIKVGSDVKLTGKFIAKGEVDLRGATIDGDLDCEGNFTALSGSALSAISAKIGGGVLLHGSFAAAGTLDFYGTFIDRSFTLDTQTPLGTDTTLILQDAKAGVLN